VHRDVKPSNIFFGASGEIKLGDFGVAHLQDLGATQTGGFLGTLAYMSPEQVAAAPISFAADQYSLGVMLYQLVCGVLPFVGPDVARQHLVGEAVPPSERRAGIPKALDPLLLRMLAKSPDERYPSMAALSEALLAFPWASLSRESATVVLSASEPSPRSARFLRGEQRRSHGGIVWYSTQDVWNQRDVIEECCAEEAWQQSVQRLAQCHSPFLQTLLLQEGGSIFWESLSGETLAERLRKGPIEKAELRRLLWAMASAVSSLHQVGESHGAISAEMVLCSPLPLLLLSERGGGTTEDDVAALQSIAAQCLHVSIKDVLLLWESLSLPKEQRPERFPESAAALAALLSLSPTLQ
jgi:hypothetical protein